MKIEDEIQNIENAMERCSKMEEQNSVSARRILSIVLVLTITLITILFFSLMYPALVPNTDLKFQIPDTVLYAFLAIYTLTFSILMAVYRLHIGEAARLQHYIVGFMRVRVAGSNNTDGYQTEVRETLTTGAFDYIAKPSKEGKLSSPIPGHPGVDFTTSVLNKFLDSVEVVGKKGTSHNKPSQRDTNT
ncbi:hypothetical protein FIU82_16485 (plasmid) [Pseudoalteromonas sp. THAF3]|uniref:hypothetical protein n=1 Tax=Pseudoalteromonas sp. THAF3 TaxID=2587843 RepID=UPI001268FE6A|nr:hypothetical protein [Pseudoalteromonas sp. THAF3]QFU06588.1 hypothetical protein FIU82_16485 [Pseudoalteromonas sp. THAF3]